MLTHYARLHMMMSMRAQCRATPSHFMSPRDDANIRAM